MSDSGKDFEAAAQEGRRSFLGEYVQFLRETGKYWMVALLIVLLAFAILMVYFPAAAPFIYTLF